jgi:hypothetical protein
VAREPKRAQEGVKRAPRETKSGPREAQECPREPKKAQETPKREARESPREAKRGPREVKRGQEAPIFVFGCSFESLMKGAVFFYLFKCCVPLSGPIFGTIFLQF